MHRPNPCPAPLTTTVLPSNRIRIGPTSIDPLPRRAILPQSPKSTNPTAPAVGAIGGNDARKACLWHGPGVLSLVADRYAPSSQVAGQRPCRARRHRRPGALDWEVPEGPPLAVSPLGGPEGMWTGNPPGNLFPDIGGYGNHEYGNRGGIFRLLSVLDRHGITP